MDTPHGQLATAVDEFLMLVKETADFQQEMEATTILREAQRILVGIGRRVHLAKHRYVVGVLGLSNVGKSTLLNALLGGDLAPRRNGPCTAVPIEFHFGPALQVSVHYRQSLHRPVWLCDDVASVHQRLSAIADDSGAAASRSIRKVEVAIPQPLLAHGLIIADTPGFGAAQAIGSQGTHEAAVKQYLQQEVSQVFWVVLAEQGIGKRELEFRDQLFGDICDDVVVTGCEDWDQMDRNRFRRRFAESFAQRLPAFHFVSGLEGLRARTANDSDRLESAGITALEQRIRELAELAGRELTLRQLLWQLADDLRFWADNSHGRRMRSMKTWWRPDSWLRWKEVASANAVCKELTTRLEART